jgi:hypothetical protein
MDHLAAALAYAEQGLAVFPLGPRSKQPQIAGGRGLHDATTDKDKITSWWEASREANIGLRTGISFDAIDVDSGQRLMRWNELGRAENGSVVPSSRPARVITTWCCPQGSETAPAFSKASTTAGPAGTSALRPAFIPAAIDTCGSLSGGPWPAPAWLLEFLAPERVINNFHVRVTTTPRPTGVPRFVGNSRVSHKPSRAHGTTA